MSALDLRGVSYTFPSGTPAVVGVDLRVAAGELVLLTGPTGCGKSTLLRLCAGLLQRHGQGRVDGQVRIGTDDPAALGPAARVGRVGFVSQVAEDQIVTGTLGDELAFAPESAGWDAARIERRIDELLRTMGLPLEPSRDPRAMSGGQQQRLVVGAALAAGAGLLLLDEPLASLDPQGAAELLSQLRALARDGAAILLVEHRLELVLPWADRVVTMADGRIDRDPAGLDDLRRLGLMLPELNALDLGLAALGLSRSTVAFDPVAPLPPTTLGPVVLRAQGLRHKWPGAAHPALDGVDLTLRVGERLAVIGRNGAGKSSLLQALVGSLAAGSVNRHGRIVDVPQDPDLALCCETVYDELALGPREAGASRADVQQQVAKVAEALGISALLSRPPQGLSRGQRLRVAVGAALTCRPAALLLDEPTAGQDHEQVEAMLFGLSQAQQGGALLFCTHDLGLALRHATRVVALDAGRVIADGPPGPTLGVLPETLPLPPLAAWCRAQGLPIVPVQALVAGARIKAGG
jgi:energy-coupling factor transport system ATP-binding protein